MRVSAVQKGDFNLMQGRMWPILPRHATICTSQYAHEENCDFIRHGKKKCSPTLGNNNVTRKQTSWRQCIFMMYLHVHIHAYECIFTWFMYVFVFTVLYCWKGKQEQSTRKQTSWRWHEIYLPKKKEDKNNYQDNFETHPRFVI